MRIVSELEELSRLAGSEIGAGEWHRVTQEEIDGFAQATGDHQWIHVDPERAREGPFGTTIAHGYLTLSLLPALMSSVARVEGVRMGINYGLNRVRFPAPVPVNSRVRASARLKDTTPIEGGIQAAYEVTIELENSAKPACVAETVVRYLA
ncbi:MAG: MaoC family dehydratase [Candidatus Dormibacteria bacterium]